MTFNEFQRELQEREIPTREAYLFTLIYERLVETENQLTMCARLVESMAGSLSRVVELNARQQAELRKVVRGSRPDGVEVHSVAWDDDDE
jgi:predicted HTH domain antitoxin